MHSQLHLSVTASGTRHFTGSTGTQSLLKALTPLAFIPGPDIRMTAFYAALPLAATAALKFKSNRISGCDRDFQTGSHVAGQVLNSLCG